MTSKAPGARALPDSSFAIPATRDYPINTRGRAVAALARVATDGTPTEQAKVRAAVRNRYPTLPSSQGNGRSQAAAHNKRAGHTRSK